MKVNKVATIAKFALCSSQLTKKIITFQMYIKATYLLVGAKILDATLNKSNQIQCHLSGLSHLILFRILVLEKAILFKN